MDNEKEIPFGAFDSELMYQEITIPEGFEATIEGNKIILKKTESDDMKIRKELIKVFSNREKYLIDQSFGDITVSEALTWLEKQGNVARLWTIQDAKKGDILADKYGVYIYDQLDIFDESACVFICGYQYSDKKFEPESMICNKSDFYPATKEQRDLLFQKIKEAGYEWDENNKMLKEIVEDEEEPQNYKNQIMSEITDLVKHYIKQKPTCGEAGEDMKEALRTEYEKGRADAFAQMQKEWSEEDEVKINRIVACLENLNVADNDILLKDVDWLKSLKDRYTWKPSEEQMRALEYIIDNAHNTSYSCKIAKELLEQLKKLKGE